MKFTERKEFTYDAEVFKRSDTQTALKIHDEYVRKSSRIPLPAFFEVDRDINKTDDLWHMPLTERTIFSRRLEIPAIIMFERPNWLLTKLGIQPVVRSKFWLSNLGLQAADYFPAQGDFISHNGYRCMVNKVVLEPGAFWQQTNVWLGLVCETIIAPEGDARPIQDINLQVPAEKVGTPAISDWPGFPPTGPTNTPHNWP